MSISYRFSLIPFDILRLPPSFYCSYSATSSAALEHLDGPTGTVHLKRVQFASTHHVLPATLLSMKTLVGEHLPSSPIHSRGAT